MFLLTIIVLERLALGRGKRRGRPPAWMTAVKRRGRPQASLSRFAMEKAVPEGAQDG